MRWRWDQGRLDYFRFDNVVRIAEALSALDGVCLDGVVDPLRAPLMQHTGLGFKPDHYRVWRNYARVFRCAMLATDVDRKLAVTALCRKLADPKAAVTPDEYLNFVFSRFALPFPAFEDYSPATPPAHPFSAMAKFAISRGDAGISLGEVFSFVIGNECTGTEDIAHYAGLPPTNRRPQGDEARQVREMLVFMGQSSFLKWFDGRLYLDTSDIDAVLKATAPVLRPVRKPLPEEESFAMAEPGSAPSFHRLYTVLRDREVPPDSFREGGRTFCTHGKSERSPLVRRRFFETHPSLVCDACRLDVRHRYPWTDNILELHHILPLSATILVNGTTTSLDDMVALCPNCHKSIHVFYRKKLQAWGVEDFGSKEMARDVYRMAKGEIIA